MTDLKGSQGRCQFCHRTAAGVAQLIAGDSAFICTVRLLGGAAGNGRT